MCLECLIAPKSDITHDKCGLLFDLMANVSFFYGYFFHFTKIEKCVISDHF